MPDRCNIYFISGKCGKVVGERKEQLSQTVWTTCGMEARMIVDDNSHVLAKHYELLPSARRFRVLKYNTVSNSSGKY